MATGKRHYGVRLLDIVTNGVLRVGDEWTFEPRRGEVYRGIISDRGELSHDAASYSSPSTLASKLAGNSRDGWTGIKVRGRPLADYRDDYLNRHDGTERPVVAPPITFPSTRSVLAAEPTVSQPLPKTHQSPGPSLRELTSAHLRQIKRELEARLAALTADQFEEIVAEFLRRLGYMDVRRTGGPGDRNIDVTAAYPAPFAKMPVRVQVKHRRGPPNIGPSDVAAFRDRAGGVDHTLLLVTNVAFTDGAKETASEPARQKVHLIDGESLIETMIDNKIGVTDGPMGILEIDTQFWNQP